METPLEINTEMSFRKTTFNYKLIYELSDKCEELVKDAEAGIRYWRAHKHRRCYKCRVYGHEARDCDQVCKECLNKHESGVCIVALLNWFKDINKNIERLTNSYGITTIQEELNRISNNITLSNKIKSLNNKIRNKIIANNKNNRIINEVNIKYQKPAKPATALKVMCVGNFTIQPELVLLQNKLKIKNIEDEIFELKHLNKRVEPCKYCLAISNACLESVIFAFDENKALDFIKRNNANVYDMLPVFGKYKFLQKHAYNSKLATCECKQGERYRQFTYSLKINENKIKELENEKKVLSNNIKQYENTHSKPCTIISTNNKNLAYAGSARRLITTNTKPKNKVFKSEFTEVIKLKQQLNKYKQQKGCTKPREKKNILKELNKQAASLENKIPKLIKRIENLNEVAKNKQNKIDAKCQQFEQTMKARDRACKQIRRMNKVMKQVKEDQANGWINGYFYAKEGETADEFNARYANTKRPKHNNAKGYYYDKNYDGASYCKIEDMKREHNYSDSEGYNSNYEE